MVSISSNHSCNKSFVASFGGRPHLPAALRVLGQETTKEALTRPLGLQSVCSYFVVSAVQVGAEVGVVDRGVVYVYVYVWLPLTGDRSSG